MLSDEEKKAIEWLKKADWFSARLYSPTILNLIEKQSKEIEELKQEKEYLNCIIESDEDNYINKDKIKAKIEELKNDMLNENESLEIFYRKKYCKEVLQSLLEKE